MKRDKVLCSAWSIILSLLAGPSICCATHSVERGAEVRIVILPPRAGLQEHAFVKSFQATALHADFASSFRRIYNADLEGEWYVAKQIPFGEYEVRVSIGTGKSDIVRVVRIESHSENLYFGSNVTMAHIVVVDPLGEILKDPVVDKVVDNYGTDYASAFGSGSSATIPSGIYQVQAHAPEYGIATGKVCFCQAESWSVLGVGIPGGDDVYSSDATVRLKGSLQGGNLSNSPIIVHLSPAYLSSSMAAVILPASNGEFKISGALPATGDYVLLVGQSGQVLGNDVLRLPLDNVVSFKLKTGATISLEPDGRERE